MAKGHPAEVPGHGTDLSAEDGLVGKVLLLTSVLLTQAEKTLVKEENLSEALQEGDGGLSLQVEVEGKQDMLL